MLYFTCLMQSLYSTVLAIWHCPRCQPNRTGRVQFSEQQE